MIFRKRQAITSTFAESWIRQAVSLLQMR